MPPTPHRVVRTWTRKGYEAQPVEKMRLPDAVFLSTVLISATVSAITGYVSSRLTQRIQEQKSARRWRLAVASEIRTLRTRLLQYEFTFESRVLTGELSGSHALRVLLQPGDISVFTNSASSIGFFDTRTALRVLRFYADIRTLQGHAIMLEDVADQREGVASDSDVCKHRKMVQNCQRRAHVLVRHLRHEAAALRLARLVWGRERRRLRSLLKARATER